MKNIKYFFQFIVVVILFFIFKLIGLKLAVNLSSNFVKFFGPLFRSKKMIKKNILKAFPDLSTMEIDHIIKNMWGELWKNFSRIYFYKRI